MNPRMSTHAAGFTLVEVVVALAIFVIGALAIVRIFPPSLSVIQNAGDRTTAANLSRDVLARFSSEPGLAPDAVYDDKENQPGVYNDFAGAVVGTISRNDSLPGSRKEEDVTGVQGTRDITGTALGHFRRIVGERHTVLADQSGNKYILLRHPYVPDPSGITPNQYPNPKSVEIYIEDRVNGVRVDGQGYLDFREARLASDNSAFFDVEIPATLPPAGGDTRRPPAGMRSPLPPPPPPVPLPPPIIRPVPGGVTYYVSYRYKKNVDGRLRMQGVTDEPLYYRADNDPSLPVPNAEQVFEGRTTAGSNPVIAGAVDVRFTRRITLPSTSTFPIGDEAASFRGIFGLNTSDASVAAGKTVMVNYTVRDWRWLVDDAAPAQTPVDDSLAATAKMRTLPIRFLNDENTLGSGQADPPANPNYIYSLLTSNPAGALPNADVTNFEDAGAWNGAPTPSNARLLQVTPKLSQVTYNLGTNLIAPRVRTVYWTLDGWAVQTTVAARDYLPYEATRYLDPLHPKEVETEPWREYYWLSPTTGIAGPNVYFHWGDAGKTVAITYQYVDPAVDTNPKTATGNFTINEREEPVPSAVAGPSGFAPSGSVVSVTLSDPSGEPFYDPPIGGKQVVGILSVQGLSVRARTAWMDNGRYTQSTAAGYRP